MENLPRSAGIIQKWEKCQVKSKKKSKLSYTDMETHPDNVEVLYPEEECFILKRSVRKTLEGHISPILAFGQLSLGGHSDKACPASTNCAPVGSTRGFCPGNPLFTAPRCQSGLTSLNIGLLHGLGGEERDVPSSALPQEAPHVVPGAGVQPGRGLIQEQHLKKAKRSELPKSKLCLLGSVPRLPHFISCF